MKKSKIIVPALGLLLLSTAASVSGTVAWFTANRTYTNTISSFKVGTIDGALKSQANFTNMVGVRPDPTSTETQHTTIQFRTGEGEGVETALTDGSYNFASGILYTDNASATASDGTNNTSFVGLTNGATASNWKAGTKNSIDYYYGFKWDITFTYEFGGEAGNMNFFLDLSATGTNFTVERTAATETHRIQKALRVAVISAGEKVVLAPFRTHAENATEATKIKHVIDEDEISNGASANAADYVEAYENTAPKVNVSNANLVTQHNEATVETQNLKGTFNFEKAADKSADQNQRVDYLGQFVKPAAPANEATFTVTVVVWLEGLDPVTVSEGTDLADTLKGALQFYVATPAA